MSDGEGKGSRKDRKDVRQGPVDDGPSHTTNPNREMVNTFAVGWLHVRHAGSANSEQRCAAVLSSANAERIEAKWVPRQVPFGTPFDKPETEPRMHGLVKSWAFARFCSI
jgi:hypothetical protein